MYLSPINNKSKRVKLESGKAIATIRVLPGTILVDGLAGSSRGDLLLGKAACTSEKISKYGF
jgi:hypothetical protein